MISPINFTGIKNIGYAKVYKDTPVQKNSRVVMNMELTDDDNNKDLSEYRKILTKHQGLKNEINDKYINIEYETQQQDGFIFAKAKLNGNIIIPVAENFSVINFMKNIVNRVAHFKSKDFQIDDDHHLMKEAQEGLIYNEHIDDYIDGSEGRLSLLDGTDLTEKFDYYLNCENAEITENEEEIVFDAVDNIVATLHEPAYVHNGAQYLGALLKGYSDLDVSS